jgi:hypothetical protein
VLLLAFVPSNGGAVSVVPFGSIANRAHGSRVGHADGGVYAGQSFS